MYESFCIDTHVLGRLMCYDLRPWGVDSVTSLCVALRVSLHRVSDPQIFAAGPAVDLYLASLNG